MDKEKQHIDTEFIDQSWQNMSELLDKDMPVQKRKRRIIWLWFLGISAIIIFALTYRFNTVSNQNLIPKTLINKEEKIAKNEKNPNTESLIHKDKNTASLQKNSRHPQVSKNFVKPNNKFKPAITSSLDLIPNISTNIKEKQNTYQPAIEFGKKEENLQSISPTPILTNEIAYSTQRWLNPNISMLPLPAFPFFSKEQAIEIIPIINPVDKKLSRWRFGLYAGGLTNKLGGFRIGFHSNFIRNPKWRLHLGLGYATRIQNNSIENNGNEFTDLMLTDDTPLPNESESPDFPASPSNPTTSGTGPATGIGPITGIDNSGEEMEDLSMNFSYTKFHYFELPILFQYHFRPKWTVDFGGQIALLYGVNYEQQGISNFTTNPGAFSNMSIRTQDTDNRVISNLNFAAIGGVSYQISPQLAAYSNYHFSSNYLTFSHTNSEIEKRWQQIEVGVRYYFK